MVKRYRANNGPRSIFYDIVEVDGSPVRIPGGFVKGTGHCEVEGITAIDFMVRGDAAGIFVLQLNGDERIMERLCDYGSQGSWHGTVFMPACDIGWDASKRERVKLGWDSEKKVRTVQ